jgi:hypothetical protein
VRTDVPAGTGRVVGAAPSFFLTSGERKKATVRLSIDAANPPTSISVRALSTRSGVDQVTVPAQGE